MEWLCIIETLFFGYIIVQFLRLVFSDCDLQLQWAEKLGKSTKVLSRKVVWITGASSGIGEHLSYELAKSGCRLVLSARREDELQRVKKQCLTYGNLVDSDIFVLTLDLLKFDKHRPAVDEVISRFKKIDILVNNAGRSQRAEWEKTSLKVDRDMLELNVLSVLSLTKLVLPNMIDRKEGHIVNMSSVAGKMGLPGAGSYIGSKHAIQGWFDCLRIEMFSKNVYVTNICPGPVFSNLLQDCFTDKPGQTVGASMKTGANRMSTDRCARLCTVAIANKMDEVWISKRHFLFLTYVNQYMPMLYKWIANRMGIKGFSKLKEGKL
ncbi:Dehydrogenase/reductase SDR member 7 [Mactra antiquata]